MATKKIKINFKMPTPTAAERLHAQQQKNRKAAGLPDPSEYKKKLDSMKSEETELVIESIHNQIKKHLDAGHTVHSKAVGRIGQITHAHDGGVQLKSKGRTAATTFSKGDKVKLVKKTDTEYHVVNEEVEQLDEISDKLKASYVSGAKKQIKQSMPFTKKSDEYRDIAKNFIAKRQKGIARANEEVEQLDEMPESNMKVRDVHSHLKKAGWSLARSKGGHDVFKHPKAKHSIPVPRHSLKAPLVRGIMKASKIEEQLEKKGRFVSGPIKQPFKSNTIVTAVKEGVTIGKVGGRGNIHMYDRNPGPKDGSELENIPFHAKTEKQKKLQNALNDLGKKMKETHPKLKEDYDDPVTIIKKGTNIKKKISADAYDVFKHHGFRKEAKDVQEYDYEGDMAKSDLRSILHHAKELHDMIEDNTNLAEWCQSKITLAEDYLSTVANYMRSEMNEEVKKNEYHISKKHKFPTKDEHAITVKHTESGREHVHSGKGKYLSKLIKSRYNINHYFEDVEYQDNEQLDEKKNLPGLWANIHAKRKRGEPPAKPGDKDYPKTLNIESAEEPTEGEMKGKQGYSRKAQIVRDAAKGKKSDNPDKFQKDPELSSEIHKT